jgi:hypothetical protein
MFALPIVGNVRGVTTPVNGTLFCIGMHQLQPRSMAEPEGGCQGASAYHFGPGSKESLSARLFLAGGGPVF